MSAATLDVATIAATLIEAPTVASAAARLKVGSHRLKARCVADDVLRPLFYKLADRGRSKRREGMRRLRWSEADGA